MTPSPQDRWKPFMVRSAFMTATLACLALAGCISSAQLELRDATWRTFEANFAVDGSEDLQVRMLWPRNVADSDLTPRLAIPVEITRLRDGAPAVTTFFLDGDGFVIRRDRDLTPFGFDDAPRTEAWWPSAPLRPPLGILLPDLPTSASIDVERGSGDTLVTVTAPSHAPVEYVSLSGTFHYPPQEAIPIRFEAWDLSWDRAMNGSRSDIQWGTSLPEMAPWPRPPPPAAAWPAGPLPVADHDVLAFGTPWTLAQALGFLAENQPGAHAALQQGCVVRFEITPDGRASRRGVLPQPFEHRFRAEVASSNQEVTRYDYVVRDDELLGPAFELIERTGLAQPFSCSKARSGPGPVGDPVSAQIAPPGGWQHAEPSAVALRITESRDGLLEPTYIQLLTPKDVPPPHSPYAIEYGAAQGRYSSVNLHPADLALLDQGS